MELALKPEGGIGRPPTAPWPSTAFQGVVTAVVAFLVLAPLLPLAIQAFIDRPLYQAGASFSLAGFSRLFASADLYSALWNTLVFSVGATAVAQFIGVAATILISRTDLPGRSLAGAVFLWPLFVSHLVLAFGWILLIGPSGQSTGWLAQQFGLVPWNL